MIKYCSRQNILFVRRFYQTVSSLQQCEYEWHRQVARDENDEKYTIFICFFPRYTLECKYFPLNHLKLIV